MKIEQKNCVFDQQCPFFFVANDKSVNCIHPVRHYSSTFVAVLFDKCPLKKDKFEIELKGGQE